MIFVCFAFVAVAVVAVLFVAGDVVAVVASLVLVAAAVA